MSQSVWRERARRAIDATLAALPAGHTPEEARKALSRRDAYPFGERIGWAYKCWCEERRKVVTVLAAKTNAKLTTPPRPTRLIWKRLPSGVPWLEVSCGWCGGYVKGGCMVCVHLHVRLRAVVAHPEFAGLREDAEAAGQPAGRPVRLAAGQRAGCGGGDDMSKLFYEPTAEHLTRLSEPWCASYSGGKDSTSLVTWVEWLRRSGWVTVDRPRLVRSDTGVEEQNLVGVAEEMARLLEGCGWECALVRPAVHERLYCQILGRGLPPVHPGIRRMRWCTRSTKIDPMDDWREGLGAGDLLSITGLRLGESDMRDEKLRRSACAAGGECGIPDPGEGRYSPILHWKTCQVIDWLSGRVGKAVRSKMGDVFRLTQRLIDVYELETTRNLFGEDEVVGSARFGCVGCPAIGAEASAPAFVVRRNGTGSPLNELYDVWHEARDSRNRLVGFRQGEPIMGPIRLEARKRLFARVMDIQARAGVTLVTPEDEAFIRDCWERKVYPRGWSESDEATPWPAGPLFDWEPS